MRNISYLGVQNLFWISKYSILVLPKVFARANLDPSNLGGLIDLIDGHWKYGTPPTGNANYAWIQHFLFHLAPNGEAGFVLAKGALTSKTSGEGNIRD